MNRSMPGLPITNSLSSLRLTSIESVMPSSHLLLCCPLLLHILLGIKNKTLTWKYVLSRLTHPLSKITDNTILYNVHENISLTSKVIFYTLVSNYNFVKIICLFFLIIFISIYLIISMDFVTILFKMCKPFQSNLPTYKSKGKQALVNTQK